MARRLKGEAVHGWVVVDKPLGMSSAAVVSKLKRIFNAQKVGHGGTLDPLATGILPIGFGEATKTMPYIVDASKDYAFTVTWGIATDSDDREGTVVHTGGHIPEPDDIEAVLPNFMGAIRQVPPAYSAVKIDGKRAYALARSGETVEISERTVEVQSLNMVEHDFCRGETTFEVTCGKGTYVRSLGRDIALKLGTWGHISMLRRLRVGPFSLKGAISLAKLEELGHSAPAASHLQPITTALDDIPAVAVTALEAADIKMGRVLHKGAAKQGTCLLTFGDQPVAMAHSDGETIRALRVFNVI